VLQNSGSNAIRPNWRKNDRTAISDNGKHLSQDFIVPEGGVFTGKRIATSDETVATFANQSVRDERSIAVAQYQFAGNQLLRVSQANGEDVARPQSGQHAGSCDPETHLSEVAQDFGGQIALGCLMKLSGRIHRITSHHQFPALVVCLSRSKHHPQPGYEIFRLPWQPDCVDCTLPQLSALVSKTLS
jgi:hypothetical protein